jgi:hypothetical protein
MVMGLEKNFDRVSFNPLSKGIIMVPPHFTESPGQWR